MAGDLGKANWEGTVQGVQPRIRLHRSFDQRFHSYQGYTLRISGRLDGTAREFLVAVGKVTLQSNLLRVGDQVRGKGHLVVDRDSEICDLFKVSALQVLRRATTPLPVPPPFLGIPQALPIYQERGHRRLLESVFRAKCTSCLWGCEMPVDITDDLRNPTNITYRRETFCYGPKSCPYYEAGPTRKVLGRKGDLWEENDSIDASETSHRSLDD